MISSCWLTCHSFWACWNSDPTSTEIQMAKGIVQLLCVGIQKFFPQETWHKHKAQQLASGDCSSTWLATLDGPSEAPFFSSWSLLNRVEILIQTMKNRGLPLKSISKFIVLKKMCNSKQPCSYNFNHIETFKTPKPVKTKYRHFLFHLNSVRPIYSIPKRLILEQGPSFSFKK